MKSRQTPLHRLLDHDYNESFDSYIPRTADLYDRVVSMLPSGWQIKRKGIYFHCASARNAVPLQGWKIHVSSTPADAAEILNRVALVIFESLDTDFKFALDMSVIFLMNSKNWSRGGSGKFITVYPSDNLRFLELIEKIYLATRGLSGPYILSDRRYKDSHVVFYRYGGMRPFEVLNVKGERTPMLIAPDGSHFPDERRPYPVTPPWVRSILPVEEPKDQSENSHCLKQGRYQVENVLSFSNAGGVYLGVDRDTGEKVVIKEARPCVNSAINGDDAVKYLQKEHRLLDRIRHTGVAPEPLDLFEEWEHWFLVEEFITGPSLASHSAAHNILLRTRPTVEDFSEWRNNFLSISANLFALLQVLHEYKIVFTDLSTTNVILETATGKLKLIDFEGAYELGVDRPTKLYTPGFVSQQRLAGSEAALEDDYYAAGAVLMSYIFPITGFFHLNPKAKEAIMSSLQKDSRLPEAITRLILELMDPDVMCRPSPARIVEVLEECSTPAVVPPKSEELAFDFRATVQGIIAHLNDVATYTRKDRLFPTDQKIFVTNPLSLAWGAAGVGYALANVTGNCQEDVAAWMIGHKITPKAYAPGLYAGMSGIAWCLLEMGKCTEGEEVLHGTFDHKLLNHSSDIFYGIAGWGLACLRFFVATGKQLYLDQARFAGQQLLKTCQESPEGCYWPSSEEIPLGFAHGSSGIAVFLLYLYLVTQEEELLATGQRGLQFDLQHAVTTKDGGLSWRKSTHGDSPISSYWESGSAGVGMAVLRYWRLLDSDRYWSILEQIFVDADRKYTVLPGMFMGLAGLGDFLMDMYEATGDARFLRSAYKVAEGIMQFQVERRRGIAFPGDSISRLSCSYANGGAGIAVFLNRLSGRKGSHFMLDCLFQHPEANITGATPNSAGLRFLGARCN